MDALAQNERRVGNVQVVVEFGTSCGSNTMVRPKNLRPIVDDDSVVGLLAGMRRGE